MVDVLQGPSSAVLHADPQLLPAAANERDREVRGTPVQQRQPRGVTPDTEANAESLVAK